MSVPLPTSSRLALTMPPTSSVVTLRTEPPVSTPGLLTTVLPMPRNVFVPSSKLIVSAVCVSWIGMTLAPCAAPVLPIDPAEKKAELPLIHEAVSAMPVADALQNGSVPQMPLAGVLLIPLTAPGAEPLPSQYKFTASAADSATNPVTNAIQRAKHFRY